MTRIASVLPGRIRIRDPLLRKRAILDQILPRLEQRGEILTIEINAAAGSMTLHTEPSADMDILEQFLDQSLIQALDAARHTARVRAGNLHRHIKMGMLGTLGASLVLIATRQKKGHALAGGLFVGLLGLHLYHYRRNLFR